MNTTPVKKAKASTPSRSKTSTSSNNLQNSVRSFIDKEDYDLLPESSSEEIKKASKSVASKERSHYSSRFSYSYNPFFSEKGGTKKGNELTTTSILLQALTTLHCVGIVFHLKHAVLR